MLELFTSAESNVLAKRECVCGDPFQFSPFSPSLPPHTQADRHFFFLLYNNKPVLGDDGKGEGIVVIFFFVSVGVGESSYLFLVFYLFGTTLYKPVYKERSRDL